MMTDGNSDGASHRGPGTLEAPESAGSIASKDEKIHFPGLNGLRFFAAFSVVLYHIEALKSFSLIPNWVAFPFLQSLGPYGVVCFFTLSGFLITYLLLEESERTGNIRVRRFYMRRILRIWPLYYLVVALGFLILPFTADLLVHPQVVPRGDLLPKMALFLAFLPNLAWVTFGITPIVGPLWSVGVEEQFYLLWPILLRGLRNHALLGIVAVVLVMLGLRFGLPRIAAEIASPGSDYSSWVTAINFLWTLKLECMAMGALAAYWLHGGFHRILRVLYFPLTQLAALAFIFISLWRHQIYGQFDNVAWGSAFAVLIVNLAANPRSLLKLENRPLDYLGKISFGIYVYHSFAIVGVLLFLRNWMPTHGFLFNGLLYGLAIALTVGLAALSHRYYESPFLRLKIRYMVVRSSGAAGDPASGRGVSRSA